MLLVSSRETRRWVIPKGWPSKKMSDAESLARRARKRASPARSIETLGFYRYRKVLPAGHAFSTSLFTCFGYESSESPGLAKGTHTDLGDVGRCRGKLVREPGLKRLFAELEDETRLALRALQQ